MRFLGLVFLFGIFSCQREPESGTKSEKVPLADSSPPVTVTEALTLEEKDTFPPYEQILLDSGLVDVQTLNPRIGVDLKYSSADNFVHQDVYGRLEKAYLRPVGAQKLAKAEEILESRNPALRLLVLDAARPRRVQKALWHLLDVPFKRDYLAPPWEGSVHNYGLSVDVTLSDSLGNAVDMGTPYDYFGKKAQPKHEVYLLDKGELSPQQIENRLLLRSVMKEAGFFDILTEWWHFNAIQSTIARRDYSVIE